MTAIDEMYRAILTEQARIRCEEHREPNAVLHLSVSDMQEMAEESLRQGGVNARVEIRPGDEGTVFGMRCVADGDIERGRFVFSGGLGG